MMPATDNATFVRRAFWLIRLRWIAVVLVALGAFFLHDVLDIAVETTKLYVVAVLLAAYNGVLFLLLNRFAEKRDGTLSGIAGKVIKFQLYADLSALIVLLHYSGGIENPFVFFLIINIIAANFFLSVREGYLQATLAVLLLGVMILLEYLEVIPHHCLEGYIKDCSCRDAGYVLGTFFVFAVVLYVVVYITGHIFSSLKETEMSVKKANAQLLENDSIKDKYVTRLTHDIRGHLSTIHSCLGVVLIGTLDEQSSEFADRAFKRTKKLTDFIKTFSTLTKIRLNSKTEMSEFSLKRTVNRVVDTLMSEAGEKSIQLNCHISDTVENMRGIEASIEEMLTTLLSNAIKFTPENGEITIRLTSEHDSIRLQIIDTGVGIPEAEQAKIFDEFYRAGKAMEVEKKSPGLDLIIVKYIIEVHKGTIAIDSQEGRGTTFTITLPCNIQ
jgi:signal transduction histidine kinase